MSSIFLRKCRWMSVLLLLAAGGAESLSGQAAARAPGAPAPSPKAAAPIDLTGYWVAIVTEDWRWRMVTPAKGDYASVPITMEAKKVADTWDPAKDEAAGEQCKSYGAAGLMRIPGRLHITWQDENTLKIETDAGTQTRLMHFGDWKAPGGAATLQGDSVAKWEMPKRPAGSPADAPAKSGDLKVVTTHMRPGYLRKNGVPYSGSALLTEYFDILTEHHLDAAHNGEQWLVLTTIVEDPQYLQIPWLSSLHFRKEADGAKWDPQPCSARW